MIISSISIIDMAVNYSTIVYQYSERACTHSVSHTQCDTGLCFLCDNRVIQELCLRTVYLSEQLIEIRYNPVR